MQWTSRRSGGVLVGEPRGRVDEETWEAFLADLNGAIGEAGANGSALVLDLDRIEYMSSRGLRVLTLAKREADSKNVAITLARPNQRMREIFEISRYDKIFNVTSELEA